MALNTEVIRRRDWRGNHGYPKPARPPFVEGWKCGGGGVEWEPGSVKGLSNNDQLPLNGNGLSFTVRTQSERSFHDVGYVNGNVTKTKLKVAYRRPPAGRRYNSPTIYAWGDDVNVSDCAMIYLYYFFIAN